jgi:hypothetical protein
MIAQRPLAKTTANALMASMNTPVNACLDLLALIAKPTLMSAFQSHVRMAELASIRSTLTNAYALKALKEITAKSTLMIAFQYQ